MSDRDAAIALAADVTRARLAWHRAHLTGNPHSIQAASMHLKAAKTALTQHHTQEPS